MTKTKLTGVSRTNDSSNLSRLARRTFLICLLLFISSLLMLSASVSLYNRSRVDRSVYPTSKAFTTDQLVRMGSVEVMVKNIERSAGSAPYVAPDGYEYVSGELILQNITDVPLQIMPSVDTYAKTESGAVASLATYAYTHPFRAGELLPGETIRGQIGYLVSRNETVKLYIDASWSGGVLPFKLEK